MKAPKFKYPIGIQTFEKIREGGYIYADKTGYDGRQLHKIGISFSTKTRTIEEWEIA